MAETLYNEAEMSMEEEVSLPESDESGRQETKSTNVRGWIKVTAIAAASVLAGGLAAVWIYRKAIVRLQDAEPAPEYSNFGISSGESNDET